MKFLISLVVIVLSSVAANAQFDNIFKRKPWENAKLQRLLKDSLSKFGTVPDLMTVAPQQVKNGVYKLPLKGIYLGENGKGDEVYAMTPDNMPCLVPGKGFVSNMPVAGIDKSQKDLLPLLEKDKKEIPEVKIVP
jgi:hypothetical protein